MKGYFSLFFMKVMSRCHFSLFIWIFFKIRNKNIEKKKKTPPKLPKFKKIKIHIVEI